MLVGWRVVNPLRWVEGVGVWECWGGGFDTVTLVALQWGFVGTYILVHPKIHDGL